MESGGGLAPAEPALYLIGEASSRRTAYMEQAARQQGISMRLIPWADFGREPDAGRLRGAPVKIDPPVFSTVCLEQMRTELEAYIRLLEKLEESDCQFLNTPRALIRLLDKKKSKQCLLEQGIAVTRMSDSEPASVAQLLDWMRENRCYGVFIKPRYFSGAAGTAALRLHPVRGDMVLYTSCQLEERRLINTKRLYQMRDRADIQNLLTRLLSLECVLERWHPKALVHGKSFDLRVVYQFGHIAHMVARCGDGPVTNLHLNNRALDAGALDLSPQTMREIDRLCASAMEPFEGLSMAGLDILLEKNTLRPLVIEMNGQGDLIYQDIFHENRIYRHQAARMRQWLEEGK